MIPEKVEHKYVVLDIETTGGNFRKEKITELALYLFDGQNVTDEYNTLVNPQKSIPVEVSRLTGITNEMVRYAPTFPEVARKIVEMTEDRVLVGHNVNFDYSFLREEYRRLGYSFRRDTLDTVKMARKAFPGLSSYSLGKLCRNIGINIRNRHRAAGDALATLELFKRILNRRPGSIDEGLIPLDSVVRKNILDGLPNATGIYFFLDASGKVIYVGKSNDIRQRVLSHFANDRSVKGSSMREKISSASFEVTGSETLALLRESAEIKARMPVFNARSRRKNYTFGIYVHEDEKGYLNLGIQRISKDREPLVTLSSKTEGKAMLTQLWEKYQLCQKLCGLYHTKHACFHYSIRQCKGACLGLEPPASYNDRVRQIMDIYDPGLCNFAIIDKGRKPSERSVMIVRNGEYQGYAYVSKRMLPAEDLTKLKLVPQEHNRDVWQVINQCLRNEQYIDLINLD